MAPFDAASDWPRDTVPAELVGREVSVRALAALVHAGRARGIALERLATGTGCNLRELEDPRARIPWSAFATFLSNLGAIVGEQELLAIGADALDSPVLRAVLLPGRLLFGPSDVYRWIFSRHGPTAQMFACQSSRIVELSRGHLRFEMRTARGYTPSHENHLLTHGALIGIARAFGVSAPAIVLEPLPDGMAFDIRVPEQRSLLGAVRGRLGWLFAARAAGEELRRAHAELYEHYLELLRQVAAREQAEAGRQRLEEQLLRAQKLEAMGRLAGGVAHDFNNLLTVILSYTSLSLGRLAEDDPMHAELTEVLSAGERAASLTRQLLIFSRQEIAQPGVLDLNHVVAGMENMLRRLIGEDIDLKFVAASDLDRIKADRGQLEQVVMNLVVNARDAMPRGGKLTIETANVELGPEYRRDHAGVTEGRHVMLAVSDTGVGMDKPTQAKIFEPFFTTKPHGKGTGLGLSTVFGIAKQNGGSVWVYSEVGHGTTFKVYLPATDAAPEHEPRRAAARDVSGTETILVVDDDDPVRAVIGKVLRRNGYTVLDAANVEAAARVFEAHGGRVDLLVTDVVMPNGSGRELADRLVSRAPDLGVIFMSGYTDDAVVRHGVLNAELTLLQKPINASGLLHKVREALDDRAATIGLRTRG